MNTKLRQDPMRPGYPNLYGDPNTAPRCGALTRKGEPCRQPAMPNGRCRMHGGKSTGPRTLDGLARLQAARTRHGRYSADNRRWADLVRELKASAKAVMEKV